MTAAGVATCTGTILLAAGGIGALIADYRKGLVIQVVGVGAVAVAAIAVFAGSPPVGAEFRSGIDPAFGLDALSAFFMLVLCIVAAPALIFARSSLPYGEKSSVLTALTAGFVLSMAGLVAAREDRKSVV